MGDLEGGREGGREGENNVEGGREGENNVEPTRTYLPAMKINMSTIGNYGLSFQDNQHAYTSASPW